LAGEWDPEEEVLAVDLAVQDVDGLDRDGENLKIAIPVSQKNGWNSTIAPHFGHASFIALYDSKTGNTEFVKVKPSQGCAPIASFQGKNVGIIFCKGMGRKALNLCAKQGIKVKTGDYSIVKQVIDNLDHLPDLVQDCGH
jgi:predicted Fe-Mo cluster-binding NifX family protein